MKVHVIPHLHWDREWYKPFYPSMVRLVKIVGKIIELLEMDERYRFTFDGHTNWLDDYLRFFPNDGKRLKELVKKRRLFVGPWFIQADQFVVSGESLIRNLMIGSKMAEELGHRMEVGYIPDQFGQMENIPQILVGFNIERAVVHRGVGDEVEKDEFWWVSPDGSRVLAYCMKEGYTNEEIITEDLGRSLKNLKDFMNQRSRGSLSGLTILMDGADFTYPKEYLTEMVEKLKESGIEVEVSDLERFFDELVERIPENLPSYTGEFRNPRYDLLVTGVYSTRLYIKKKNLRVSNLLERYVEPILTVNYILNSDYPHEFLLDAWKNLLLCHAHDSISGCGSDSIHMDVETRLRWVEEMSGELLREAVKEIFDSKVEYRGELRMNEFMVYNPNPFQHDGVVELNFKTTERLDGNFVLKSMKDGKRIPGKVLKVEKIQDYIEDGEVEFKDLFKVSALVKFDGLAPLGFERYILDEVEGFKLGEDRDSSLLIEADGISNGKLGVFLDGGTVMLKNLKTGFAIRTGIFKDDGDAGDEYNFCPPDENESFLGPLQIEERIVVDEKPFRVRMILRGYLSLPSSLAEDGRSRSRERVKQNIELIFTLHEVSEYVDLTIRFRNVVKDHRLRLLFVSNLNTDFVLAGEPFGLVKRRYKKLSFQKQKNQVWEEGYREADVNFYPFQRLIVVRDEKNGFAVSTFDTTEYEFLKEGEKSVLELTLIRSVGYLSKAELPVRSRYAGPIFPTPDAQVLRDVELEMRLILSRDERTILKSSEVFLSPPIMLGIPNPTSQISHFSFPSWEDPEIAISALKKSENDDGIIMRFFNISDEEKRIEIGKDQIFDGIEIVKLNEKERIDQFPLEMDGKFLISVPPRRIVTLSFKARKERRLEHF